MTDVRGNDSSVEQILCTICLLSSHGDSSIDVCVWSMMMMMMMMMFAHF